MNDITQEIFGNQLYTVGKKSDTSKQVFTPTKVVDGMIDLLPAEIFNPDTTFIDIYCKSGIFLKRIYEKLDLALQKLEKFTNPEIRRNHILNNQIYGLVMDNSASLLLCNKVIYGDAFHDGHLLYLDSVNVAGYSNYEDILHKMNPTKIKETIEKMFNRQGLGFDVVVGNPPYNRGGDIDFVNLGYELCSKYTVMITPAKWQTAEANQRIDSQMSYGDFRKKIVPHMKEVVYYPDCYDLFDIKEASGICYYILYKDKSFDKCLVINKQELQKSIESFEIRAILNRETLWNVGNSVVDLMGRYNKLDIENMAQLNNKARYFVNSNNQSTKGGGGYSTKMQDASGKWVTKDGIVGHGGMLFNPKTRDIPVITKINVIDSLDAAKDLLIAGASSNLFYSDSLEECESYVSYITTKLVRFLILINFNKQTLFDRNTFRFVPSPMILDNSGNRIRGEFDHIYTDDELYKTWNIPQKYIEVIEAVVKERDNNNYKAMVEKCYYLYNCGITFKNVLNTNYNVKERNSVGIGIFIKNQLDTIFSKSTKVYQLENLQNFLLNNQNLMDSNQKVRINFYSSEAMQDGVKPQNILKVLIKLYPKAFNGEWYRECLEMIKYFIPGQSSLDNYNKQTKCIEKLLYIYETVASLSIIVGSLCPQDERLSNIEIGKNCEFEIDGRNIIIETIQE